MSSFSSQPHNYYNNPPSIAWKVTNTDLVTLSLAFAVVVLRCYTKFFLTKSRGWDDCKYSHCDLEGTPRLTREQTRASWLWPYRQVAAQSI